MIALIRQILRSLIGIDKDAETNKIIANSTRETTTATKRIFWANAIFALVAILQAYISYVGIEDIQRAFVVVDGLDLSEIKDDVERLTAWQINTRISNEGGTPARRALWGMNGFVWIADAKKGDTNPPDVPKIEPIKTINMRNFPLGPKATLSEHLFNFLLDARSYPTMASRSAVQYIYGEVRYDDILPFSPRHVTRYCFMLDADRRVLHPAITYFLCGGRTNCSDDECK